MPPDDDHPQRKRRRSLPARDDIEEQPSAKRRRADFDNYPPEFWDALSKITLTRRALKEFDRRTAVKKSAPEVAVGKRSTRLLRSDTKKLLHFAKNGGPNLNHLRGFSAHLQPVANMSKPSSRKGKRTRDSGLPSSDGTKTSGTTDPYNSQFQQMLIERRVYPDGYEDSDGNIQEPANINSLRELLPISRSSLSPSRFTDEAFKDFQRANRKARSEAKAMSSVVPIITGAKDNRLQTEENIQFNNLEKFAPGLKVAQPDKYYGARPEQVDERIRRDLGQYIVPSTSTSLPVAPNFFFEGKSAGGRPDVAQRQVMQDNAYGARAMFQLQNYGKETPAYDGNAYIIGSSYSDGQLKLYSTHPRQSATGDTEYHMTQLRAYAMTDTADSFREAAAAYRNARDFAQKQRDRLIAQANATQGGCLFRDG
ncbi:hypothetical protein CBER1_11823 [Cercospora berteroae]|uniref:DUF7924 domain-containing protein n=1 Tax=Cercospora berteroae TaxID=357750 RepID=A0A2S6C0K2_9PEZI|nr:hypothetical protein CBER1_11823 [Cercospora berteroae]